VKKRSEQPVLETREFFERVAVEYASDVKEGDELKLGYLRELAKANDSLLDIGCGNGYFTDRALAETNISWACALDISRAMLSLNKKLPNKHVFEASVLQMPFKPHSFAFVHFDAVLHHIVGTSRKSSAQQACDVIRSCVALTRKGGFLVLTERCVDSRISSVLIFYALKFLAKTRLARLFGVARGLVVSFLTPDEFLSGIRTAGGSIVRTEIINQRPTFFTKRGFLFRLGLCRDHPRIHVLVSPV